MREEIHTSITRLLEYQMHTMMIDSSFQTKVVAAYIPFGVEPPEASIKYEILKWSCIDKIKNYEKREESIWHK
jgi:hypothetical protein